MPTKPKPESHAWLRELWPSEYDRVIREGFAFLVRGFSFASPVVDISSVLITHSYSKRRVAIRIAGEVKDPGADLEFLWLTNGAIPSGWRIDSAGRIFRVSIYDAMRERNLPVRGIALPPNASPQAKLGLWVDSWVAILRDHFADILADSEQLFVDLNRKAALAPKVSAEDAFFAKAERLFKSKDYRSLVKQFAHCSYPLSPLWISRLEYAKRQ